MTEVTKPTRKRRTTKAKPEAVETAAPTTQHQGKRRVLPNGLVIISH